MKTGGFRLNKGREGFFESKFLSGETAGEMAGFFYGSMKEFFMTLVKMVKSTGD